ncbi:MAG: ATP-binding protein [Spirochaetaceae bacterium]
MNRISIKLTGFFLSILLVSTALSFALAILFSHDVADEIAEEQRKMARLIRALEEQTQLSIDDIVSVTSTDAYPVKPIEELEEIGKLDIPQNIRDRIATGKIVSMKSGRFDTAITIFRLGDRYATIGVHAGNTLLSILASRLWDSMATYVAIAAILFILLTRRVVHPVLRLTEATKKVATGDFTVQLASERNDEIGQLTDNFNRMVAQLQTIEHLRKDFISNVSHEIKTPLSSIHGFARLLNKPELSPEERSEYAKAISEEATRLSNLTSAMLKLSRLENSEGLGNEESFRLDEQIRHAVMLLEPHWSSKNIELDIRLQSVWVQAQEELLQQVWQNLLNNAIKFSHDRGRITITLVVENGTATVAIRDCGIGMRPEDSTRIFEKFFQGEQAHSGKGSGLGLSLVKHIVDMHGASIRVDAAPGEGSCFTVYLPRAHAAREEAYAAT